MSSKKLTLEEQKAWIQANWNVLSGDKLAAALRNYFKNVQENKKNVRSKVYQTPSETRAAIDEILSDMS